MAAAVKPYLMTRGWAQQLDYDFLGESPPVFWWHPLAHRGRVVLEQPEIVVRGGASPAVLVSGVPSIRRDVRSTRIRYTLVVEELTDQPGLVRSLVAMGLDPEQRERFGARLDAVFDADTVDGMLSGTVPCEPVVGHLAELLGAAYATHPEPSAEAEIDGSWAGPVGGERARGAFLARIERLAAGEPGLAFSSHALTTVAGAAQAAAEQPDPCAILLVNGVLTEVEPLRAAPVEPSSESPVDRTQNLVGRLAEEAVRLFRCRRPQ
ncbi:MULTISPECIES: hypothetical protein [Streptacidiphilus]|uniref:Uncharacterized protein n=1 Tax=Streptacidiphilus cavernicola TaxID=3342716 RepID=A0ABV6UUN5_9ACTN|nr:hypothetical protein [Streptacidiphilus jeojiense]